MKLVGWALVFLPIAIWLGYRDAKLMAIVIMLASPATPSCYIMSRSMHSEGTLTSSVIVLTTMCSAFTITAIIYIFKSNGTCCKGKRKAIHLRIDVVLKSNEEK